MQHLGGMLHDPFVFIRPAQLLLDLILFYLVLDSFDHLFSGHIWEAFPFSHSSLCYLWESCWTLNFGLKVICELKHMNTWFFDWDIWTWSFITCFWVVSVSLVYLELSTSTLTCTLWEWSMHPIVTKFKLVDLLGD